MRASRFTEEQIIGMPNEQEPSVYPGLLATMAAATPL